MQAKVLHSLSPKNRTRWNISRLERAKKGLFSPMKNQRNEHQLKGSSLREAQAKKETPRGGERVGGATKGMAR